MSNRKPGDGEEKRRQKKLKRIPGQEIVLGDALGEGAYGQVREGLRVKEGPKFGQRVAVKIISRKLLRKVRNGQQNLKREINCLKKLKHPNIIQLYDVIDNEELDKIYLMMELANYKSLQDVMDDYQRNNPHVEGSGLDEEQYRNLFHQLVLGLRHCHDKGVVHRDIKPSNLQLNSEGVLKIIDFGVAESLDQFSLLDDTEKFAGTPAFQPPEVANGSRSFKALKVDIWAAGVTLYVMATGKTPFAGDKIDELYSNIGKGEYEVPPEILQRETLSEVITRLMEPDPEQRMTLEELVDHAWFKEDDMSKRFKNISQPENIVKGETLLDRYLDQDDSSDESSHDGDEAGADDDHRGDAIQKVLSGNAQQQQQQSMFGMFKNAVGGWL
mmetsp:Transcript_21244/g.41370  ORF Transcript_21244/g.41370 Transcript_21244/m.41370 type:complete len:385 (+) Transcript_21244:365-1519(+)|eukprot:CAMPEP_0173400418 /NCGR_PEP_ID=MMETSP1356-20130122/47867_1 /TAXON_ID=77927 ORGANISM="Hemiselmis virescens, Strain PCC157" /NCGR_SAMPLE_ID=MMETSP1356 /ASSEMBLY_ACC=CAM_ASM_000847 /LENGTH=384 /DNA_ID=CAMNT_0014360343 /DNA_START=317 /DNA_END=1471 /DNA_ORIENTATION=+